MFSPLRLLFLVGFLYKELDIVKRILIILAVVISLTLNFIIIDTYKSLSFYNTVAKGNEKIEFLFTQEKKKYTDEALEYFNRLSKNYNTKITKVTYISNDEIVINTTDEKLKDMANNNNKMMIFDSKLHIKIYALEDTKLSENGTYYLSGSKNNTEKVKNLIEKNVGHIEEMDNSIGSYLKIDQFSLILCSLLIYIYMTVLHHYLNNNKSNYKILYDLGYVRGRITLAIIKSFKTQMLYYILLNILLTLLIYILIYKDFQLLNVIGIILLTTLIILLLSLIIIIIITYMFGKDFAKNKKYSNKLLMMYTYMLLTIVIVVFLVLSTQSLINNYREYEKQKISYEHWTQAENTYKTNVMDRGQLKNRKLDIEVNKKFKNYYNSNENKGFIIDTIKFLEVDGEPLYTRGEIENYNIDPAGKTITIDQRFLKDHPQHTQENKNVLTKMIYKDNTQNIIVPVKYKSYESEIKDNFKDEFTFRKDIFNYNGQVNESLDVNIIWTKNNSSYFTYDAQIRGEKNTIIDPIAIIESGNTHEENFEPYFSQSYMFKSMLDHPYKTIESGLKKYKLNNYVPTVSSVFDSKIEFINELKSKMYKYTFLSGLTALIYMIVSITFINLYFKSYQYVIFLKRNLGYSYFEIHKWVLFFLCLVNFFIGVFLSKGLNHIAILFYVILLIVHSTVIMHSFKKLNKENINQVLKGKKE